MSEGAPVVESVVLSVIAPAPKGGFPGLDKAISKLLKIDNAITSIESRLANLGGNVKLGGVEKLSGQMTDLGTTATNAGKAGATAMNDQGAAAEKAAAAIARLNEQLAIQNSKTKELRGAASAARGNWEEARDAPHKRLLKQNPQYAASSPANQNLMSWLLPSEITKLNTAKEAVKKANHDLHASVESARRISGQIKTFSNSDVGISDGKKQPGLTPSAPAGTIATQGKVVLDVPGYDVLATLVGKVKLTLGPDQVEGGVTAVEKAQKAEAKAKAIKAAGDIPGNTNSPTPPGAEAANLKLLQITTGDGYEQTLHKELGAPVPTTHKKTTVGAGDNRVITDRKTEDFAKGEKAAADAAKKEQQRSDFITSNEIANAKKAAAEEQKAIEQKFATIRKLRAAQAAEEERARNANEAAQRSQLKGATDVYRIRRESEIQTTRAQDFKNVGASGLGAAERRELFSLFKRDALQARVDLHAEMAGKLTGAPQLAAQQRLTSATSSLATHDATVNLNAAKAVEKVKADAAKKAAIAAKATTDAEIKAADTAAKLHESSLKRQRAASIAAIPSGSTAAQSRVATAQANVALNQGMASHHASVLSGPVAASNPAVQLAAVRGYAAALNSAATATQSLNSAQAALANTTSHVGKNFAQNLMHITQWAMGAGALYGTIGVFKSAITSSIQMEYQMARLGQVFRGEGSAVRGLTNDVLRLAAANGRSSGEAMESAIQWSRLGLNRLQVTEAVRVSLMAANVAEITAAEATDHLSSLMRVYDLNVRSLSGALGMLNATSNTFNVTNKDLLEGITRTSSAAKQAGLSLAELIGFIGAGVGSTGQTGTNIGNSMKSMIGAFSAPDKQKMMREQFRFEPTDANGDLKDMGDLLAQLYVHFQKLNEAQKQSFIFNIAGKNQASRVTALLDNYIKAQTLAIQALLGMNSAEKENEKIRETAKAQLQGLITEFERMSIAVGKFGTDKLNGLKLFSEVILAMKNSLAVLSGAGGVAGAILVSVMAAIAAKSLLMMASMGSAGKGGSFLTASMQGLRNALTDVRLAMLQSLATTPRWIQGLAGVSVAANGTVLSVRGAAAAFRAFAVAAAVALGQMVVVIGLIAVGAALFNKGMEAIGGSSDSANKAIDDFSESAERARGAAEAATLQVKLFDTTLKALANNPNQVDRAGIIANVVEGLHPYTSDDMADEDKRRAKDNLRADSRRELTAANALGAANERNAAFERHFADAAVRASAERVKAKQRERQATEAAMDAAMEEGRRLKNSWRGGKMWFDWLSNKDDRRKNADKIEELNTKKRKRYHEDSDEQEASQDAYRSRDARHLTFLEVQKRLVSDIQSLWNEMPGESYDSRLDKEIGANAQILRTLEDRLAVERALAETLNQPRASELEVQSGRNRKLSDSLKDRINAGLSGEDGSSARENFGFNPFAPETQTEKSGLDQMREHARQTGADASRLAPQAREMLPMLEKWWDLQGKINEAETESARIRSTPGAEANQARIRELTDSANEHRRTQAALENSRGITRTREQIKIGADFGTMESGSFKTGYSDTDALVNQFKMTGRASERHAMRAAELSEEADMASRFVGSGVASPSLPRARSQFADGQGPGLSSGERRTQSRFLAGGSPLDAELTMAANLARIERLRTGSVIERGMALSQGNDMLRIATELNQRQSDLEKAKVQAAKDYNKTLALSGPAEMLKMMALSKLTKNFTKINGGQFLAFDEGSKKTIDGRMRPGWELNENRRALNSLGLGGDDPAARALAFEKFKAGMEGWMSVLRKAMGTAAQPQIDAAAAAAASMGRLGSAADAAAAALLRLAGAAGGNRGVPSALAPAQGSGYANQDTGEFVYPDGTSAPLD